MDLSNFIIYIKIQSLPKIGLHVSYMLISALFANIYSSQLHSLNEEQNFYFELFTLLHRNKLFSQKILSPYPQDIKWSNILPQITLAASDEEQFSKGSMV